MNIKQKLIIAIIPINQTKNHKYCSYLRIYVPSSLNILIVFVSKFFRIFRMHLCFFFCIFKAFMVDHLHVLMELKTFIFTLLCKTLRLFRMEKTQIPLVSSKISFKLLEKTGRVQSAHLRFDQT